MADKYIINMPEKTTPVDTDLTMVEDSQDTKRMTWANFVKPIKDMIGNLASLTTNHKTTLVGAVNELKANNSLLTFPVVYRNVVETNAYLNTYADSFSSGTWYRTTINLNEAHPDLGGGSQYVEGYKGQTGYEWQIATTYINNSYQRKGRSRVNGVWGPWV